MTPSSMEAVAFAVVLGVVALAAVVSLFHRSRRDPPAHRDSTQR